MNRYQDMFARARAESRIAFIPFVQVGDPSPEASFRVIMSLVDAGADALELGIPFSDPVADGPTIQASAQRALLAGTTPEVALGVIARVRAAHPGIPIGLLVYANLVAHAGVDDFYARCAMAGVDSVLVADVPSVEGEAYSAAARRNGVDPVFIVASNSPDDVIRRVARLGAGYTYVVGRAGVTGADEAGDYAQVDLVSKLCAYGAPPVVFGFGISEPGHLQQVARSGAAGAISGSAVVQRLVEGGPQAATDFVRLMATSTSTSPGAQDISDGDSSSGL